MPVTVPEFFVVDILLKRKLAHTFFMKKTIATLMLDAKHSEDGDELPE